MHISLIKITNDVLNNNNILIKSIYNKMYLSYTLQLLYFIIGLELKLLNSTKAKTSKNVIVVN